MSLCVVFLVVVISSLCYFGWGIILEFIPLLVVLEFILLLVVLGFITLLVGVRVPCVISWLGMSICTGLFVFSLLFLFLFLCSSSCFYFSFSKFGRFVSQCIFFFRISLDFSSSSSHSSFHKSERKGSVSMGHDFLISVISSSTCRNLLV